MLKRWQVTAAFMALLLACSDNSAPAPTTGALAITFVTTGDSPDPDGYTFSFDGGTGIAIDVNGAVTQTELTPGDHLIAVSGLAGNCVLSGDNPRTATVTAGDTTAVDFAVTCPSPCGDVQFAAATAMYASWWALPRPKLTAGCARRSLVNVEL